MRVIAGKCRSLPLKTPPGDGTRPTTDRTKETLFNVLMPYIPGCRFLDLFAGSGGIGIEALSRGAQSCCFVENNRKAIKIIEDNLAFTKLKPDAEVLQMDAVSAIRYLDGKEQFDVVFMDPPYLYGHEKNVIMALKGSSCLCDDAIIVIEAALETDLSWIPGSGFEIFKQKKYKTNQHIFLRMEFKE